MPCESSILATKQEGFFSFAFGVSKEIIAFRFTIVSPTRHCPAHIIIGRAIQLNICHAQRDSFILGYFGISTRLCPLNSPLPIICHCPACPNNPLSTSSFVQYVASKKIVDNLTGF